MGSAPSHKKDAVRIPKWAKEQDKFRKGDKYPNCRGTYDDCPEEIKPDVVDDMCKMCPKYKD